MKESDKELHALWPQRARLEFCGVSLRYAKGLPFTLRALSFTINPGESVGIVGRSGAGKRARLQHLQPQAHATLPRQAHGRGQACDWGERLLWRSGAAAGATQLRALAQQGGRDDVAPAALAIRLAGCGAQRGRGQVQGWSQRRSLRVRRRRWPRLPVLLADQLIRRPARSAAELARGRSEGWLSLYGHFTGALRRARYAAALILRTALLSHHSSAWDRPQLWGLESA